MRCSSLIFSAAALLLAGAQAVTAADQVAFRFAPPTGTSWKETATVTTAIPVLHRDRTRRSETTTVSRLAVPRPGELNATVVSTVGKLDGEAMESPLAKVLPGLTLRFKVGPDGQILDLLDFPKLLDQAKKTAPTDRFERASPFFTADALLGQRRAAADPLAGLAGKTLAVGGTASVPGTVQLPSGEVFPVHFNVTLQGKEPIPACPACVRLNFTAAPVLAPGKPADLGATGGGTALLDPATLLTWSLKHEETIVTEEPGARNSRMRIELKVESSLAPEK